MDIESEVAHAGTVVAALDLAMLLEKHILLVPGISLLAHWGLGYRDFVVELATLLSLSLEYFVHSVYCGVGRGKSRQ